MAIDSLNRCLRYLMDPSAGECEGPSLSSTSLAGGGGGSSEVLGCGMGYYDEGREDGKRIGYALRGLARRKQADSDRAASATKLAKELSIFQLITIGVGSTIGAGVYVLVGTVAREHSGPALFFSFLIAGIAAAFSAFCYAELSSRYPSAGSAYHYSYICVGEGVAWIIGWALILEYTIGGSAVARGISPNLALFFGGPDSLPSFLARAQIPGLDIVVDPCAAILVFLVTGLLCTGIKESTFVQGIVTCANVCVMLVVVMAGGYVGYQTGWVGYRMASGFLPFGVNGMLAGSATVFFAYIGFDSVASAAEEVKNPQRDLPMGIGLSLSICCFLYMMVSAVIVGLVPYFALDPDTPIPSAFSRNGMEWAMYVVSTGAALALCSTLMGSLLPQPRILMAMARDGLLPRLFSDVNRRTQVPVKGTIFTGFCSALLAFLMDVSQLAGMVSVGTLLAFTIGAISILILRYIPPELEPVPASLQESIDTVSVVYYKDDEDIVSEEKTGNDPESSVKSPLIVKQNVHDKMVDNARRRKAAWSIVFVCLGILVLTSSASSTFLSSMVRYGACCVGGLILVCGLVVLSWIDQDEGRHSFGHSGAFICPFVPFLPVCCILINAYLLINLGADTWIRVSIWLAIGVLVYLFYGRTHSVLKDAVYVPTKHVDEMYKSSKSAA